MLKVGIKLAQTAYRVAGAAANEAVELAGIQDQVESFGRGLEAVPGVKDAKHIARTVGGYLGRKELPLYKEEAGPNKVGIEQVKLFDKDRSRPIPTTVYYPKDNKKKSPVVVLSHGLAGNSLTYRYLGKHLASYGYTVFQPIHEGSDTKATLTRTPLLAFSNKELVNRMEDVSFVLDEVQKKHFPAAINKHADLEKVALVGHSFGAIEAQALAGVKVKDNDGNLIPVKEDRIDAFVAMSPFGDSFPSHLVGLDTDTYDKVEKPIFYMSGDHDGIFTLGKGPAVHNTAYLRTGSEEKYNLVIADGQHADFAQVLGVEDKGVADMAKSTTLAFLDAQLRHDQKAEKYLNNELPEVAVSRGSTASVPHI